eukprot:scaffold78805_cov36-Phaeocystis_antarctica.AAC.1
MIHRREKRPLSLAPGRRVLYVESVVHVVSRARPNMCTGNSCTAAITADPRGRVGKGPPRGGLDLQLRALLPAHPAIPIEIDR